MYGIAFAVGQLTQSTTKGHVACGEEAAYLVDEAVEEAHRQNLHQIHVTLDVGRDDVRVDARPF